MTARIPQEARDVTSAALPCVGAVLILASQYAALLEVAPDRLRTAGVVLPGFATMGLTLTLVGPSLPFRRAARLLALLVASSLLSLVTITDLMYFRQFRDLPTVSALAYASQAAEVAPALLPLLRASDLWLMAPPLVFAGLLLSKRQRSGARLASVKQAAVLTGLGLLLIASVLGQAKRRAGLESMAALAGDIGLPSFHFLDGLQLVAATLVRVQASPEDVRFVKEVFADRASGLARRPSPGIRKGRPNIIFVQVEALQTSVVGLEVGGRRVAPFITDLAFRGLYFDNFFSQAGPGRTSDAEFAALCSLYPSGSRPAFYAFAHNDFSCLPRRLADLGYETHAFHANRPDFWNRGPMYRALGFKTFHHGGTFPTEPRISFGLADREFLGIVAQRLGDLPPPFFAHVVTMSSHSPFSSTNLNRIIEFEGSHWANYYSAIHYADSALADFVAALERDGLLANTLLVVYGDHEGVPDSTTGSPMTEPQRALGYRRVPLMILGPGLERGLDSRPGSQVDLPPTLARLVGASASGFLGRDLLDPSTDSAVHFYDHTAVTDAITYVPPHQCYGTAAANKVAAADCSALQQEGHRVVRASNLFTEHNLLGALNN